MVGTDTERAFFIVKPGSPDERRIAVPDRLFVGRECSGVDESRRLVIDDPQVSRHHLEVRLEPERGRACVVDTSSNGTRLNGVRIDRGVAMTLRSGDQLSLGTTEIVFVSDQFRRSGSFDDRVTARPVHESEMAMVVADIIDFSWIAQEADSEIVAVGLHTLFSGLREMLHPYRGTLANYLGDALFAVWEAEHVPDAVALAARFALVASARATELSAEIALRRPDGDALALGWAVVLGRAATAALTGVPISVLGDTANLAFRLASLAGREGRPSALVTAAVRDRLAGRFGFGPRHEVVTKGRRGEEIVYALLSERVQPDQ